MPSRPPQPKKRNAVLVVDDSPSVRAILKVYLLGLDAEIHEAENAERALQLVRLLEPDLIVADVRMPGMDGVTFTATLRNDPRPQVRCVPIILLTGETEAGLRERGLAAGANSFLSKPVTVGSLTQTASHLLGLPTAAVAR